MDRALESLRHNFENHTLSSNASSSRMSVCFSPSATSGNSSSRTSSRFKSPVQKSSITKRSRCSKSTSSSTVRTSALTILSTQHGRLRRNQRAISKRQLQRALKYGTKEPIIRNGTDGRVKICHEGIVFIYDEKRKREITSWVQALDLPYQHLTPQEYAAHHSAKEHIETNPSQYCKSHTVLLIDTSGSMRESDVTGSRSRLAAVFYAVAEDFVRQRIESGVAGSRDAISILLMTETAPVPLIHNVPTDWLTYNQVLEVYKKGGVAAHGHCCYLPALQRAEEILFQYDTAPRTQLMLTVLSDGRPSDSRIQRTSYDASTKLIESSIESLASQLGQRLTVQAIGIGSNDKNGFQTLQRMCHAADNFGSCGAFQLPSMSAAGLGGAMSSIATSLTASQLNDDEADDSFGTGLQPRRIRKVARESRKEIPMLTEVVDSLDFLIYKRDQDQVTHMVYEPSTKQFVSAPFQNAEANGVALRRQPFGEGKERFAYQFFELASDSETVVGEPLVAKLCKIDPTERRRQNPREYWEWADRFVKRFCRLHHYASMVANAFNQKLDSIRLLDPDTARVEFVPCSVYYLRDEDNATGANNTENINDTTSILNATGEEEYAVIVEPRLFGKFQKWNSNAGWTKTKSPRKSMQMEPLMAPIKEEGEEPPDENLVLPDAAPSIDFQNNVRNEPLSALAKRKNHLSIAMGDQEDPIVIDEDCDDPEIDEDESIFVTPDEVAQAFSHFSYVHGGRAMLICDLQGVLMNKIDDSTDSGYRKVLQLTDPAIHYRHTSQDAEDNSHGGTRKHKARYGRTDRGEKGMEDFLATHVCNGLCPLVTKGFFSAPPMHRSSATTVAANHSYCQPAGLPSVETMNKTP